MMPAYRAGVLPALLLLATLTGAGSTADVGPAESECGLGSVGPRLCDFGEQRRAAAAGSTARLTCTVAHPGTHTVSWVRSRDLQILAHAGVAFTADARVSATAATRFDAAGERVEHTLTIADVRPADAGRYECQVNTEPKMSLLFDLVVEDKAPLVQVRAWRESGSTKPDEGIVLACSARTLAARTLTLSWRQEGRPLPAAGVAVETRRWPGGAESQLSLAGPAASRYECLAALTDRADDAASSPTIAEVQLGYVHDQGGVTEAMQGDQSAASCGVLPALIHLHLVAVLPLILLLH